MNGLQPLWAFSETAKRGGFAAAARELGTAPSTLAKAVGRLEASLGLRLFHRTTRQVTLTADGERLFQRCQRVLAELDELQAEAAGVRAAPSGTLRIDMPIVFGRKVMMPLLARLLQQHPGLELDLRFSDAYADVVKDGIDVAIRIGTLRDSGLVARRFASQQLLLIASPAYLRRHGTPQSPDQLGAHRHIVFRMQGSGRERSQQFSVRGRVLESRPVPALRCNDGEAMVQAAVLGLGLAQVPDNMADEALAAGQVVEVLHRYRPAPMPIHAVMPGSRLLPARVRALLDLLETIEPTRPVPEPRRKARA